MEKKTNKHGHDAVGHEDEDINNDGENDSTDKYLHNRRKAIASSMKKEEVEEIEEISTGLASNYLAKAASSRANDSAQKNLPMKKRDNRMAGANLAREKIRAGQNKDSMARVGTNEEVEEIKELSKKTLASYVKGAANHRAKLGAQMNTLDNARRAVSDASGVLDDPSPANAMADQIRKKTRALDNKDYNRKYGTHLALKKLAKEEVEEVEVIDEALDAAARYGQHHTAIKELMKSIDHHVRNHKDDAHKHKNYQGKKGVHWGHVGDLAQVHSQLADIHDRLAQQGEYKKTMGESVELDEAPVDGVAAGSMNNDGHLCATKVFHKEWAEGTPIFSQHAEPDANGDIAWYDVMFENGIEKGVSIEDLDVLMSESHERHGKRKMKEDINNLARAALASLEEARGRPRKNPLPANQSDEPEPRQHIMQQLQRAKLSMRGGEHVTFKDGTKHHVSGQHAEKILAKYSAMKPAGKEDFQKKIHASHAAFKAEL
jgi:hypothetical protein